MFNIDTFEISKYNFADKTAQAALGWLKLRKGKRSVFESISCDNRIAILGSSFVGCLLIMEAKRQGFKNITVLDSNVSRHGKDILGERIHPMDYLLSASRNISLFITSSEKSNDASLSNFITLYRPNAKVVTWRELVFACYQRPESFFVESSSLESPA